MGDFLGGKGYASRIIFIETYLDPPSLPGIILNMSLYGPININMNHK